MTELAQQTCDACRADAPRVTDEQMPALAAEVPQWQVFDDLGILKLVRQFRFTNFVEALAFSNQVGELAEQHGHHPAILTEWGKVTVTWWTHKIKGLHKNDFVMAAKTDALS
ncbi:4a-hydroxytetrahydrobiopterin dehydratase [Neiella sp. HB171785]|uniref:Putative pterin-4-alpha-carbinolamine dehydratase n=1 Tax=Neiella litorisoli TaxID=2771431 RepID=A0A8J6UPA4_9GAMM|nr:4a-hydroxytetrahydrobiopterin dehydratase [Neiella litorisoli]MBD1387857.1 4a-hydroxytetrahydrobiopterin dehydratase [Neiella litorisoli]